MAQDRESSALLNDVLDAALEITGADMGTLQLLEDGVLRIVAQKGFNAVFLNFFEGVQGGDQAACGEAMRRGERVIVEDVTDSPIFQGSKALETVLTAGVRAVQSTPIVARSGALIGMFSTHFQRPHRPDQRELRLLDFLSQHAAHSIEREQVRDALATKERQLATITENVGSPITMCNRNLRYVFANEAYARLIGRPVGEILGQPIADVLGAEAFETIRPSVQRVLGGERVEYETPIVYPGTGKRYMHAVYVPDIDVDGTVRGWFAGLADITERKRVEEELRRAEAELREANRHKDEFIAVLGHELRNPLSVIRNSVEILRTPALDSQSPATLDMLERQVSHMVRLVDDLLDMNRVSRGNIEFRSDRINLADVVNRAVENSGAMIENMAHRLTVTMPTQPVYLAADSERLMQAVANLLSNACKFMDRGGRIDVSLASDTRWAVIRVRDHGIGIASADTRRIFEMFAQVDKSMQHGNGLGIGLTLVKAIVEQHGGTVEARSDGAGRGSEFIVRLPISAADLDESANAMSDAELVIQREILIIDDNRDSAQTLSELLQAYGHKTHIAHDGIEGLEAAQRLRPEVVLLDIGLPTISGYDACRGIRGQPWGEKMVLVALTGCGQARDVLSARQAGFDHHLVKPVNYQTLQTILAAIPPKDPRDVRGPLN